MKHERILNDSPVKLVYKPPNEEMKNNHPKYKLAQLIAKDTHIIDLRKNET